MAISDANRAKVIYKAETTIGTQATGTYETYRMTGESLNANRDFTSSQELRSDRQVPDLIATAETSEGELNFEWSVETHDDFIESALQSTWSAATVVTDTDISMTAGTRTIAAVGADLPTVVPGEWIYVEGFANATNNGLFRVSTASGEAPTASAIVIDEEYGKDAPDLVDEAAGATVSINKGKFISNGVTKKSFTVEVGFEDVTRYKRFLGMEVSTMSLSAEPESILTGTFGFLGRSSSLESSTVDASPNAPTTTSVLNGVENLGEIRVNNKVYNDGFLNLEFTLNNNPRPQRQIGSFDLAGVGFGTMDVTGSATAYFTGSGDSDELYQTFLGTLNNGYTSIDLLFKDDGGALGTQNMVVFSFPRVRIGSLQVVAGGNNSDVVMEFEWQALLDPLTGKTVQITSIPDPSV